MGKLGRLSFRPSSRTSASPQSSRWQQLASLPEEDQEAKISRAKKLAVAATEGDREVVKAARAEQEAKKRARRQKREREKSGRIIHGHRLPPNLPKPSEANELAKQTGKATLASDGYFYFGTSPEDAQAGEDRRTIVYGVKRAIALLSKMEMTPEQFIMYALPHQLWNEKEEPEIGRAETWLARLCEVWSARQ
jgi:hypothetical protein